MSAPKPGTPLGVDSQARLRAKSSMGPTLISFFACLGLAVPAFIYMKRRNEEKARRIYAEKRVRTGALTGTAPPRVSPLQPNVPL
ncbi:hypothetical protein JCM11251_002644 [Rhodosporidiobolus azoricus]